MSQHFADNIFDVFAESEEEPATAAVGRRKRPRRGGVPEAIVDDNDEPTCEACLRPSRSARQTRGAQQPLSQTDAKLATHSVRRSEALAGGWEVLRIVSERQTDGGQRLRRYEVGGLR